MTDQPSSTNKLTPAEELEAEKQLLPRLRFMGLLLLIFCACSFTYSLFFDLDEFERPDEMTAGLSLPETDYNVIQVERFNIHIITISFAFVGALCYLIAWKKQTTLRK